LFSDGVLEIVERPRRIKSRSVGEEIAAAGFDRLNLHIVSAVSSNRLKKFVENNGQGEHGRTHIETKTVFFEDITFPSEVVVLLQKKGSFPRRGDSTGGGEPSNSSAND
jgi:hypothetical protein